jgi:hypothetical protein
MNEHKQKIVEMIQEIYPFDLSTLEDALTYKSAKITIEYLTQFIKTYIFNNSEALEYLKDFVQEPDTLGSEQKIRIANSLERRSIENQLMALIPVLQAELDLLHKEEED